MSPEQGTWPVRAMEGSSRLRVASLVGLMAAVALGVWLRLAWCQDIEYKIDESWTFQHVQAAVRFNDLPWLGMSTSAGPRNPGLSLWVFVFLARVWPVHQPPDLARAVQLLNCAALLLLAWFACRWVAAGEREVWRWATALAAVNPLMVLFQRKIWPPCVLPLPDLGLLMAWWCRDRRLGAFAWGLLGVLIGQVHLSGFFFAVSLAGWTALFDRRRVAWRSWLGGSAVGALPLIPWLAYLTTMTGAGAHVQNAWCHLCQGSFWLRWASEPLGLSPEYALGKDFREFLRYPLVGAHSTYLTLVALIVVAAAGAAILLRAIWWLGWHRRELGRYWVGRESATALTEGAALWGFGILVTLSRLPIPRHYLLVAYPLTFVWLARLALVPGKEGTMRGTGRLLLLTVCVAQLVISATFLLYVHENSRRLVGEYGRPYGAQSPARRWWVEYLAGPGQGWVERMTCTEKEQAAARNAVRAAHPERLAPGEMDALRCRAAQKSDELAALYEEALTVLPPGTEDPDDLNRHAAECREAARAFRAGSDCLSPSH